MRKVLFTHPMIESGLKEMQDLGYEIYCPKEKKPRAEIIAAAKDYEAIVCPVFKVDQEVIDAMPDLKIICTFGKGFDNVDLKYATEKGIVVANMHAVDEVTAEFGAVLVASTMRNIPQTNYNLRTIPGLPWGPVANLGHSLRGKTLGVIGMGRIGRGVAKRLLAFGMNIIYYNRHSVGAELEGFLGGAKLVSLEELLRTSDAVFINAPLNDESFHMINEETLNMMKDDAYLFNQGRGQIIDEPALIKHLQAGKLAGVGLDVFEHEPNIAPELLEMRNVVVTAHMATGTVEDKALMVATAGRNIIDYFEHGKVPNLVNKEVLPKLNLK
ncbi:MAG: NAD(P)-dependent oxidoreductase [Lachnospiraceae bacterium]|nr:NAD(P)-dependent oxidoreductase [Lachnospiraceae bacterium]